MPTGHLELNWQDLLWSVPITSVSSWGEISIENGAVNISARSRNRREDDDDVEINEDEWKDFMDSEYR